MPKPRRLNAALAVAAVTVLAGCGGCGGEDSLAQPAPSASLFPPANGQPLLEVLSKGSANGPVVSPNAINFTTGLNRVSFGVFTPARQPILNAQVALYAAHGPKGKTIGPFPARIEDLTTEKRYQAKTTADDPDAAKVVYAADVPLDQKGEWRVGALVRNGDNYYSSLMPSLVVGAHEEIPKVGQKAPFIHTPTAEEVGGDLAKIDTRQPPDDMHETDYADAIGKRPLILLFATPALCQSRVCGPVVDVEEQVKHDSGDDADFIHMEVYKDNDPNKGLRPQLKAFHLPSEPWLFAIDRRGIIRARIEGAFGPAALAAAVKAATEGKSLAG
jgi:hypothetical protein